MATAADPFLSESAAFDEAATRAMALAFEDVCDTLNLPADADDERKAIAIRIVDLARAGVTDAHVLLRSRRPRSEYAGFVRHR